MAGSAYDIHYGHSTEVMFTDVGHTLPQLGEQLRARSGGMYSCVVDLIPRPAHLGTAGLALAIGLGVGVCNFIGVSPTPFSMGGTWRP